MQLLKETSRPTLYRAMKYWGKKPHNIWYELIKMNTIENDVVFDPFAGSALTFFEAIRSNRKPIIADINPLTLFIVDVYSQKYDIDEIIVCFNEIKKQVINTNLYKKNYRSECKDCGAEIHIYNYKWKNNKQVAFSYKCPHCGQILTENFEREYCIEDLNLWKPDFCIKDFASVNSSAIKRFGGSNIRDIWTTRNLEILSLIFHLITNCPANVQKPLLFAFLQSVHLTTKMCALRSEKTNRPLSTSWGRPSYMYLKNRMEQNPLIQFERSIFEKNGLIKSLICKDKYLPLYSFSMDIRDLNKSDGIVLLKDSKQIKNGFNAQLIITDPPYGSIIQYGELSRIWNVWLEKFDSLYKNDLENEVIINKEKDYVQYCNDMSCILKNCYNLLKKNGLLIMTFNSNNIKDWYYINRSINNSSFIIKTKYLQKNMRSSEANVKLTSDLAITDYYFILEKMINSGLASKNKLTEV